MSEELPAPFSTPMPEDADGRRRLYAERQRAFEALDKERRSAAEARGRQLLLSLLDDEQRASLAATGRFEVRGSEGGRFRIDETTYSGNVKLLQEIDGRVREVISFCAHFNAKTDEALLPYARTLWNPYRRNERAIHYCCENCDGTMREWAERSRAVVESRTNDWHERDLRRFCERMLCQSDLMIGQMFKIQVDEPGWAKVAFPTTEWESESVAAEYLRKMKKIRTDRTVAAAVTLQAETAVRAGDLRRYMANAANAMGLAPLAAQIDAAIIAGMPTTREVRMLPDGTIEFRAQP